MAETNEAGEVTAFYTLGEDLISMERNGETWYYIYDGHGSVRHLTDSNGTVTDSYSYDAYGNLLEKEGTTENDFLYAGEQYNAGTGLYYLRARYMDPSTGTFISMDSYQGSIYDPVSLHKYLYANANPVMYTDPSGYSSYTLTAPMITFNIKCNLISSAYRTVLGSLVGMAAGGVIGAVDSWAGGNELHQIVDDAFKGALTGFFCGGVMSAFANFAWFLPELEVALKIQPIAGVILGYFGIKDSLDNGHGKQAVIRTLLTLPSIIGSAGVFKDIKLPKFGSKSGTSSNKVLGGSFKDVDASKGANEVGHHLPQNAYNVNELGMTRNEGPALLMTKEDHALTRTYRGRGKQTMISDKGLNARQRMVLDIISIRENFGTKYNEGLLDAIKYAKTLPQFQK